MKPLDTPNLPKGQVRTSLLQAGIYAEALRKHGTEPLSPAPEPGLSIEEREHADLICCHGGGRDIFVSSAQTALTEKLTAMGFNVRLCAAPEKDYPKNVGLNFAVGADFALGRFLYADPLLREIRPNQPEYSEARRMLKFLEFFTTIDDESIIPNNSIIREFIGGSVFMK